MVVVIWLFFGLFILIFAASVTFRLIVLHPLAVPRYGLVDLFKYFKYKQYNECKTGELVAYVGLFGKGKTLSAVHMLTCVMKSVIGKWIPLLVRKKPGKAVYLFLPNACPEKKLLSKWRVKLQLVLSVLWISCNAAMGLISRVFLKRLL